MSDGIHSLNQAGPLCRMSAAELGNAYRTGSVSPVEVARACLLRAEEIAPVFNAFTFLDHDGALEAAKASEARWAGGAPLSAVDGVPATIKDIVWVQGWPTRFGSLVTGDALLTEDADGAARFAGPSREERFLLSLATGQVGSAPAGDALGRAVLRGLSAVNAGSAYEALIADNRRGEALFRALDQLADGATGNPDTTAQSLAALRRIGLADLARQIAVELVLREGAA